MFFAEKIIQRAEDEKWGGDDEFKNESQRYKQQQHVFINDDDFKLFKNFYNSRFHY